MKQKVNRKPGIHLHKTKPLLSLNKESKPEFFWILIAKNGKTIAKSSETYKTKAGAVRSIAIAADIFKRYLSYYDHSSKEVELIVY